MTPKHEESPAEIVSFRIPRALKEAVDAMANLRHETSTAVFRAALEEYLSPQRRRIHELPGFSERFDKFLAGLKGKPWALFVVEDRGGRVVYQGNVLNSTESLVRISIGRQGWVLPRASIVAWEEGSPAELKQTALAMAASGYGVMPSG